MKHPIRTFAVAAVAAVIAFSRLALADEAETEKARKSIEDALIEAPR